MQQFRWFSVVAILGLVLGGNVREIQGEEILLWKLGEFDNDYHEFGAVPGVPPPYLETYLQDFEYRVGEDSTKQWSGVHPGPMDGWAGRRSHFGTVWFDLEGVPEQGVCILLLDFIDTHSMHPPRFRVTVNGETVGDYEVPPGNGDASLLDPRQGKEFVLRALFPVEWLQKGENRLEIENRAGSWALYDVLSLTVEPEPERIKRMFTGFRVQPGYAWLRSPEGPLQSAAGYANNEGLPCSATVTVRVPDREPYHFPVSLTSGPCHFEIAFPPLDVTGPVNFHLEAAGREPAECAARIDIVEPLTLHLAMMSHFDNGYTHRQSEAVDKQLRGLDTVVEQCERTRDFPEGSKYRWNVACFYVANRYLETRSEDQIERFLDCVRRGEIEITGVFADMLTGLSHHEELARYCLAAKTFGAKYEVPVLSAMITDAPGYTWRFPQMLAGNGINYLSVGANLTRARGLYQGQRWPFYWEAPDGRRVLVYPHAGYAEGRSLGIEGDPVAVLTKIQGWVAAQPTYRRDVLVRCAMLAERADNARPSETISDWVREWNETYERPRIVLTTATKFFERFEREYGDTLPVERGDWTGYWEDGAASSARETALGREAQAKLFDAETLLSVLEILGVTRSPMDRIEDTLQNILLYDEHTWGAAQSISDPSAQTVIDQWEVKGGYARGAQAGSSRLLEDALDTLGSQIDVSPGEYVVVYNGLSWQRSGWVIGATDEMAGHAFADMSTGATRPLVSHDRFAAMEVSSYGYRCYRLVEASSGIDSDAKSGPPAIEGLELRLEKDAGDEGRLVLTLKESSAALVDPEAEFAFGAVIYEHGSRPPGNFGADYLEQNPFQRDSVDWELIRADHGQMVSCLERSGRLADGSKVTEFFTLNSMTPDLFLRVEVEKQPIEGARKCEAVYVAFPFLGNGQFDYDAPGLLMRADRDQLSGGCRDWYSVESVVRVIGEKADVLIAPIQAPLVQLGGFTGNLWKRSLDAESGLVLSYVMNNYWYTNYRAYQEGHHVFEYVIRVVPKDLPDHEVIRFGWEQRHPLRGKVVRVEEGGSLPPSGSLVQVEPEHIAVAGMKKAADGDGHVVRCLELGGKPAETSVRFPLFNVSDPVRVDLAEQRLDSGIETPADDELVFEQEGKAYTTVRMKLSPK